MEEQLNHYIKQQQLLLNVTRQIAGSVALDETIPHILEGVSQAVNAEGVRLLLLRPGIQWQVFATGPLADAMAPADNRLAELVSEQGEVLWKRKDGNVALGEALPAEIVSVVAMPLQVHQNPLGVMWLGFGSAHAYEDDAHTFLSILAVQASIAIANARSFEAARRRREWLAAILASTPDPVLVVDSDLFLQLANPAAEELFPALRQEAIGYHLNQTLDVPELVALFGGGTLLEYTAPNGRTYSPRISEVHTEDGRMAGWVMVLRDISNFKRLNDNMSEFLSTVSHDMRSPLTFMKGYLDMLGMVGALNDKQDGFIDKIAIGIMQMSDMVEKILEAGKLDPMTGNYQLSREPSDVVEMVQKVINSLSEPAAKKGLVLKANIADGVPVLNVDQAMLSSAFTNLVENAVKYTPEGGNVEVEMGVRDNDLLFRITDDGYGISPENQVKLFQRNVRIHRKEWKRVKGSGLGLFIVKNVAERHGGDCWVESAEGEGSTFFLSIPLDGANLVGEVSAAE